MSEPNNTIGIRAVEEEIATVGADLVIQAIIGDRHTAGQLRRKLKSLREKLKKLRLEACPPEPQWRVRE